MAVGGDLELEGRHWAAGPESGDDRAARLAEGIAPRVAAAQDVVAVPTQHLVRPAAEQFGRSLVPEDDPVAAVRGESRRVAGREQVEDLGQTLRVQFCCGGGAFAQALRPRSARGLHL